MHRDVLCDDCCIQRVRGGRVPDTASQRSCLEAAERFTLVSFTGSERPAAARLQTLRCAGIVTVKRKVAE